MKSVFKISTMITLFIFCQNIYAQITVACAANVQYAMEELKTNFYKASGITVKTIYGASGKFTVQIINGAPFDVFVSADVDFPETLFVKKYAVDKPKVYALGKLVLWSLAGLSPDAKLEVLKNPAIKKIAIPDPKRAPYGREAMKALKRSGLYDSTAAKLVFGENISQTAQYIQTKAADIGFNAKSVVVSLPEKQAGNWVEVDSTLYDPIAQAVVVLKYGADNNPKSSKQFYDYLFGSQAREIFKKYGYIIP